MYKAQLDLEIDGDYYEDIVPKKYRFNPDTDDLHYADQLEDGMTVLTYDAGGRYDESQPDLHNEGLLTHNRWCAVSRLRKDGGRVSFIGIYADDTQRLRTSEASVPWIVLKATIMPKLEIFLVGEDQRCRICDGPLGQTIYGERVLKCLHKHGYLMVGSDGTTRWLTDH